MRAFVVEKLSENKFISRVQDVCLPKCDENEIVIKVSYSCLNYKDAQSSIGNPGVSRNFPHITGIDVAGTVYESTSSIFKTGERVLVTGYEMGMSINGGHSEYVKVPASWVSRIPDAISDKEIMTYGTAGLTAALSITELIENGIKPENGEILVSGATGGVGSLAVAILSKIGFSVVAITGKKDSNKYLKKIGASEVILRKDFNLQNKKNLLKERFAGVIDTVGGNILAQALKAIKYDGVATCCGLSASHELHTNVFPFILRGIRLIGIDSVECTLSKKQAAWKKLSSKWQVDTLTNITQEIGLDGIKPIYNLLLSGKAVGRYVVKIED